MGRIVTPVASRNHTRLQQLTRKMARRLAGRSRVLVLLPALRAYQLTPSFSAARRVPSTRLAIFWNAISRA
jgi:hypothetical protein